MGSSLLRGRRRKSAKLNEGGSPPAELRMIERIGNDRGVPGHNRVHGLTHCAGALAMDDPHFEDPAFKTSVQVIENQIFYLARVEGMQIQHAVDGQLDRLIHAQAAREWVRRAPRF